MYSTDFPPSNMLPPSRKALTAPIRNRGMFWYEFEADRWSQSQKLS